MLVAAIVGNHSDAWCNGDNPDGREYHTIELCLKDAGHLERYAEQADGDVTF